MTYNCLILYYPQNVKLVSLVLQAFEDCQNPHANSPNIFWEKRRIKNI